MMADDSWFISFHYSLLYITILFLSFCSVLNCHRIYRQRDLWQVLKANRILKRPAHPPWPDCSAIPHTDCQRIVCSWAQGWNKGGWFVCRRPEPALQIIKSIQIIKSPRSFFAGYQNKHRLMVKICHSIPWLYMLFRTVLSLETLWLSHYFNVWPQKWRLFPRLRCCTAPIICIEIWSRRIFFSATVPRQCWSMDHAVACCSCVKMVV